MPSVADLIKRQTAKPRKKQIVRVPDPPPATPKLPSRADAMYNFLEDRNYDDKPIERSSVLNKALITETLEKEQPDDYIKGVPNAKTVSLGSASQSNVELSLKDLSSYSLLRKMGVK